MVSTALQFLVAIFGLIPSLPLLEQAVHGGPVGWEAIAHVCGANRYLISISSFYGIELLWRMVLAMIGRTISVESAWSCAVLHLLVAFIALVCLSCDLIDAPTIPAFRDRLWGMQYQLAVAGLSLACSVRELRAIRRHRKAAAAAKRTPDA